MILYIVACILFIPISIINFIVVLFEYGFYWKTINGYLKKTALHIDIFGNEEFKTLWNKVLIQSNSKYQFGKQGDTISKVLGKNYKSKTLKLTGKLLVLILGKKHCINSIK